MHAEFDRFELLLMTGVVVSREDVGRRKNSIRPIGWSEVAEA
jgi:hypothetical protein